jgi:hypothetical protein
MIAPRASYQGFVLTRYFPLPSFRTAKFMSTKRSRVITVAAAGTLTLAAAISVTAVTLPGPAGASSAASVSADDLYLAAMSHSVAAGQSARPAAGSATRQVILFDQLRASRGKEQLAEAKAAARAAKARAAAKTAAHKAAEQAAATGAQPSAAATESTQQAQPAQPVTVAVPSGSAEQAAQQMLGQFGWSSSQFSCLQPLWAQESGWNVSAENPSSGAYGIPQALPGSKMASAGPDWETDAATQIRWGLTYIKDLYGSPCGAWSHEEADGWY